MSAKELLEEALRLKPTDRFTLVEGLIKSHDKPDKELDDIWAEEAEKRLTAYREGKIEGIPMEDIFGKNIIQSRPTEFAQEEIRFYPAIYFPD